MNSLVEDVIVKKIEYETQFCEHCGFLGKQCQMRRLDKREFNPDLEDEFPNVPFPAEWIMEFEKPKVKALPVKGLEEKFIPVVGNSYTYKAYSVIMPLTSLGVGKKHKKDVHDMFPLIEYVGLCMTAKDKFLLEFIQARDMEVTWAKELTNRNYDFVLSPNISFYGSQPSCSTVYNRLLTYKTIKELLDVGIPVVPSLGSLWEEDLKEYGKWISKCGFEYVYMNMQLLKYNSTFQNAVDNLKFIGNYIDADIILVGVFDPDRIKELEKIRKFKYISSQLHVLATKRVSWYKGVETKLDQFDSMYYDKVMSVNIKNYNNVLKAKGIK